MAPTACTSGQGTDAIQGVGEEPFRLVRFGIARLPEARPAASGGDPAGSPGLPTAAA